MSIAAYLKQGPRAKFPFIFIVTHGRSGSTLLQGILNSIPDYCIRGENYNSLFHTFKAYQHLKIARGKWGQRATDPSYSWYGIDAVRDDEFGQRCASNFLDTCLRPPNGTRCTGFKEIRYTRSAIPDADFAAYLDFMGKFFPGAGFVFNVRCAETAARSGWWKNHRPEAIVKLLSDAQARFKEYAENRDNAMIFDYDELIADWRYAEGLFDFLGEEFDDLRLKGVMEIRHSLV